MTRPGWMIATAALGAAVWAAPIAAEQGRIPIRVFWDGPPPSAISLSEPSGTTRLTPPRPERRYFEGTIVRDSERILQIPVEVSYDRVSLPLELRVRPASTHIEFTVVMEQPESCSEAYVSPLEFVAETPTEAMRRALTAGYLLSRPGPRNNCTHHRARVMRARYDRYVNLMQRSLDFVVPQMIRNQFEIVRGSATAAEPLLAAYDRQEDAQLLRALLADANEAERVGNLETASASLRLIAERLDADSSLGSVASDIIARETLDRRTSRIEARLAQSPVDRTNW